MSALSEVELAQARAAIRDNRPLSPMLGDALVREVVRLRRVVAEERAAGASLFAETGRLSIALVGVRDAADMALSDDVSPKPGNRTVRR